VGTSARPVLPVMLTAELRPFRLVFLVRTDEPATVEAAFRSASAVWGGWRCPVVAVGPSGEIAEQDRLLVQTVGIDALVNATAAAGSTERWPTEPFRRPIHVARPQDLRDGAWWPLHPADLSEAFPDPGRPAHVAVPVRAGELVGGVPRLWALAALGGARDPRDVAELGRAGVTLGPPSDPADMVLAQLGRSSLLSATAVHDVDQDVRSLTGGATLASALVVTVLPAAPVGALPAESAEAVAWWNRRALRPALSDRHAGLSVVLPVPAAHDQRVVDALQRTAHAAAAAPAVFLLPGPGADAGDLARVRELLDLPAFSGTYADRAAPDGPGVVLDADPAPRWSVPRTAGVRSTLPAVLTPDGTSLRYPPPIPVAAGARGRTVVRVSSPMFVGPRRPFTAGLHLRGSLWDGPGVSAVLERLDEADLHLGAPAPQDVLRACLTEDWEPEPYVLNDKGRQVAGLLERVRAADVDPEVLCERATLAVAAALTPRPDRDLMREVRRVADRSGLTDEEVLDALSKAARPAAADFDGLWSRPPVKDAVEGSRSRLAQVLTDLARAQLLDVTLPVRCDACGQRDWLRVDAAPPVPACPGCGLRARYEHGSKGQIVAYRASTLLVRACQNGGLIPAAAAVRLSRDYSFVLPGVDVKVPIRHGRTRLDAPRGGVRDVDLLGWSGQSLFVGEAKTDARSFGDLSTTVQMAAHLGADAVLLVSPDPAPLATVEAALSLAAPHRIAVKTMSGRQLLR
jgi:hypothetical protein